jgi:cytochrome c553
MMRQRLGLWVPGSPFHGAPERQNVVLHVQPDTRRASPVTIYVAAFLVALAATYLGFASRTASAQTIDQKAAQCAACHGDNGIPADKSWPVIWGQYQGYVYFQLRDFKSGARKSDVMGPIAQALERDDMLALGLYFSQKPWPDLRQPRASADVAAKAATANTSVGCTGCHQAGYLGEGTQPRLAGQSRTYMQQTMMDFRTHARGNNPGMSDLMMATSVDQIAALADYLAGL